MVSGPGRFEFGAQLAEIAPAVNERLDQVAGGEHAQISSPVRPVAFSQEPRPDSRVVHLVIGSVLLERVIWRFG